jgi:hypothetical protein
MVHHVTLNCLHPTQMTVGMREVARRMAGYLALEPRQRTDYIAQRTVPCVRGPVQRLYLIDRHHMCRALLDAGASRVVYNLVEDFSALSPGDFWRRMDSAGWAHPFDAQGRRCPATEIPGTIQALADDPYRALASVLRREKGYTKADLPFEEFAWANFLRRRISSDLVKADFTAASVQAKILARSRDAQTLPGWIGDH